MLNKPTNQKPTEPRANIPTDQPTNINRDTLRAWFVEVNLSNITQFRNNSRIQYI
jgi:hypothetical protein